MIQTSFSNSDAVFQHNNVPIHTAGTVQSWFEEHEGEFQHLSWSAQSPEFNITAQLWSVLETRMTNRFPPPTSLKQLEDAPLEEWHKITLETVQSLYEFTPRRSVAVLKIKGGPAPY
jgi:hypothetical protein